MEYIVFCSEASYSSEGAALDYEYLEAIWFSIHSKVYKISILKISISSNSYTLVFIGVGPYQQDPRG